MNAKAHGSQRHTEEAVGEQSLLPEGGDSQAEKEKTQLEFSLQLKEAAVEDGYGSALGKHGSLLKHRKTLPPMANNSALLSQLFYGRDTLAFPSSAQAIPVSTDTVPSSLKVHVSVSQHHEE